MDISNVKFLLLTFAISCFVNCSTLCHGNSFHNVVYNLVKLRQVLLTGVELMVDEHEWKNMKGFRTPFLSRVLGSKDLAIG